jgi:hypothetical protein
MHINLHEITVLVIEVALLLLAVSELGRLIVESFKRWR